MDVMKGNLMREMFDFTKDQAGKFWFDKNSDIVNSPDKSAHLVHTFFPDETLEKFILSIDFIYDKTGDIVITADPYYISINSSGQTCICRVFRGNTIAQSFDLKLNKNSTNALKIEYTGTSITVELNGRTLTFKSQFSSAVTKFEICMPLKSEIEDIKLSGQTKPLKLQPNDCISVSTTIDFYDDMLPEPFTPEMLESAFQKISEMGIKRVYWIHHGEQNSGFWSSLGNDVVCDHVNKTFANMGGNILAKASELAHVCGLELIVVIKPFDMSIMASTFPEGSIMAQKYGRNSIIGGRAYSCFDYVAQHPELCMQRRTKTDSGENYSPSQIELNFAEQDVPGMDVRLWTSENNGTYSIYDKKIKISRMPGKILIDGIKTAAKYLAIELLGSSSFSYGNIVKDLISVYDKSGEPIEITLGLKPRKIVSYDKDSYHLAVAKQKSSFSVSGFDFDGLRISVPSGILYGDAALNYYHSLTSENNVVGIAVGCNQYVPGAMCPSEPGARAYWLSLLQEAIDCGVDGIDIRESSHLDILKWGEYGFNAPIVNEYQKRHGINILEQDYDKCLLRMLRGEFYTEFLETACDLVRDYGKKFYLHISDIMMGSPDSSAPMEIHWDWQKWIEYIRPDGITFKAINENSYSTNYAIEVIEKCRADGIPVDYCVFTHCVEDYKKFIESIRCTGFSSINLYEFASYYKARNGKIEPIDNRLISEIKSRLK
jgi:hypothetical protein